MDPGIVVDVDRPRRSRTARRAVEHIERITVINNVEVDALLGQVIVVPESKDIRTVCIRIGFEPERERGAERIHRHRWHN
jgi:hypothetical protein